MEPKKTNIIVRNANDFKNYVDYVAELEQQCKKQKEVIDKIFSRITLWKMEDITMETTKVLDDLLSMFKEVSE